MGRKFLVTEGFKLPEPKPGGNAPTIKGIISEMLDGEVRQSDYLYGWWARRYKSLASGELNLGQVLCLVGPRDAGKSLLQSMICESLGGRSANPYAYLSGQTQFNGDMIGAENQIVSDEVSGSSDIRTRRKTGAGVKQMTVNQTQRCHAKHREAFSVKPNWSVTMSLNGETENISVLPPLDGICPPNRIGRPA